MAFFYSTEYDQPSLGKRDLRIDFMRGFVMFILVIVHIDIFSYFNFIAWERVGLISGAEGFTILSGFVLGTVSRARIQKLGFSGAAKKLFERAVQLYRVNVTIILLVMILSLVPFVDLTAIKTFHNWHAEEVYKLFPEWAPMKEQFASALLLKGGPHQIQVLGLYVVLLAFSPIALWLFEQKKASWVIGISWILYFSYQAWPSRPTATQFEYAFPILAWQLLFFHGLAAGYFKDELTDFFQGRRQSILIGFSLVAAFGFFLLAQNTPNDAFPEWSRLSWIDGSTFNAWHQAYFSKKSLGIPRLINYFVVLVSSYWILTQCWSFFAKTLGWFFIPKLLLNQ